MSAVHYSSQWLDWRTPLGVYEVLQREFDFTFDPCPPSPSFDGLLVEWGARNFVNPPYGREIPKWIAKGVEEWRKGKLVVFLIPSRTDTAWWHDYIMQASEIRFIRGRLHFVNGKHEGPGHNAPFPSCVVVFEVRR